MVKWLYYALEANVYINIGIIQTNVHFVNGRCGYALIRGPPFSPHSDTDLCLLCAGQKTQHQSFQKLFFIVSQNFDTIRSSFQCQMSIFSHFLKKHNWQFLWCYSDVHINTRSLVHFSSRLVVWNQTYELNSFDDFFWCVQFVCGRHLLPYESVV